MQHLRKTVNKRGPDTTWWTLTALIWSVYRAEQQAPSSGMYMPCQKFISKAKQRSCSHLFPRFHRHKKAPWKGKETESTNTSIPQCHHCVSSSFHLCIQIRNIHVSPEGILLFIEKTCPGSTPPLCWDRLQPPATLMKISGYRKWMDGWHSFYTATFYNFTF